jgi:DNA polymerase-4
MFRLYTRHLQGRTIFIKIRYGDFHTETARETLPHPIVSMNELVNTLSALFQKKYQGGKRIRLLGAGIANLEKESEGYQSELFETANDKERKLEKFIVEINKKHPNAPLKRGRSWLAER